jgi:RNA 2',3'-cyclic 3'-phosphodiesterase
MPPWRVFCAIEVPQEVRQQISDHAHRLRELLPDAQASWTKLDNIHLTLKFFGSLPPPKVSSVSDAASQTVTDFAPFKIRIEGTGAFPSRGPAKVLWIGINDQSGHLSELQRKFDIECEERGFAKEDRAFHPHLTLARLRSPRGARSLAEKHKELVFPAAEVNVSSLMVFRSEFSSKGSRYTAISEHFLNEK